MTKQQKRRQAKVDARRRDLRAKGYHRNGGTGRSVVRGLDAVSGLRFLVNSMRPIARRTKR